MSETFLSSAPSGPEPAGDAATDPATGRPAGRVQATILLLASCLAVPGPVLPPPVLPRTQDPSAGPRGVEPPPPIVLPPPPLLIGLTAMIAGRIVDRVGRKRLLVGA